MKEKIFVKGKDAVVANMFLIAALILFIIPILLIFLLQVLYKAFVFIKSIFEEFVINGVDISVESDK